jgi:pre-rRNA-processing protein TSR1
LDTVPIKKQQDVRKSLLYYMNHHFVGDLKLYSTDNQTECINCIRQLTSQYPTGISWRDRYPYISAQDWSFEANSHNGDGDFGTLKVTGFIRGASLSANRLVHIPEFGDFQIDTVVHAPPQRSRGDDVEMTQEDHVLHSSNPELCV